jgi:hypothetical protein
MSDNQTGKAAMSATSARGPKIQLPEVLSGLVQATENSFLSRKISGRMNHFPSGKILFFALFLQFKGRWEKKKGVNSFELTPFVSRRADVGYAISTGCVA